jgi:hypothetical protein
MRRPFPIAASSVGNGLMDSVLRKLQQGIVQMSTRCIALACRLLTYGFLLDGFGTLGMCVTCLDELSGASLDENYRYIYIDFSRWWVAKSAELNFEDEKVAGPRKATKKAKVHRYSKPLWFGIPAPPPWRACGLVLGWHIWELPVMNCNLFHTWLAPVVQ